MRALAILLALAAGGCMSDTERMAQYRSDCSAFGFPQGSPAMAQCMMSMADAAEGRRAARIGAAQNFLGSQPFVTQPAPMPYQPPRTCRIEPMGGGTYVQRCY